METPRFEGVIGDDWRTSEPWWPAPTTPPAGAPNVILVVLDDVGFAQLGCYGSDMATPTIDGLAATGIRLTNFHTTALCSPTRSCLLTGRNHHRNGLGRVADLAVGYPGYNGEVPKENGFLSEILRHHGYATYAVGKWHLSPEDETNMAAPRHSWPLGRGFDRWYGFHGGETHQFAPILYQDNHSIVPPGSGEEGYHLSADLVDQAITYLADLRAVDTERRFFLYFCTGACHSPHHAPREWIERYRGHFDQGWDAWREAAFARQMAEGFFPPGAEFAPRPHWVPAWDDLPAEQQRVAARFMECFAAYLSYTDAQLARLFAFLEQTGDRDDTLVMLVSDNGASAEGGPNGSINDNRLQNVDPAGPNELLRRIDEIGGPSAHNNYPWGWTMAGNTPFRRWKREVHEGGVADPCIVSWPKRFAGGGGVRTQLTHAVDILPTVLDLAGLEVPATIEYVPQSRIDGVSFAGLLAVDGADAEPHRRTQYFEMFGSRAIVHDGWKAVTYKPIGPLYDDGISWNAPFDEDQWELYDVAARSRRAARPRGQGARTSRGDDRPVVEGGEGQPGPATRQPGPAHDRPSEARLARAAARVDLLPGHRTGARERGRQREEPEPHDRSRRHRRRRDPSRGRAPRPGLRPRRLLVPSRGGASPLRAQPLRQGASRGGGLLAAPSRSPPADLPVRIRRHQCRRRIDRGGWRRVASGPIQRWTIMAFSATNAGMTCGYELGPAVGEGYRAPFECTATIHTAVVSLSEHAPLNPMIEFERIMSEQ